VGKGEAAELAELAIADAVAGGNGLRDFAFPKKVGIGRKAMRAANSETARVELFGFFCLARAGLSGQAVKMVHDGIWES
jgi:hypothetical protein